MQDSIEDLINLFCRVFCFIWTFFAV